MKKFLQIRLGLSIIVFLLACTAAAHGADVPDKRAIVKQAREAYYSLRRLGLVEYQAGIRPNWEITLKKQLAENPAAAQAGIRMLNGLHFGMSLDPDGTITVTHTTDEPPSNQQAADSFDQIYDGLEETIKGFFATWSVFMLTNPFPEIESDYSLEKVKSGYRLSYKENETNIITVMTGNFAISEIKTWNDTYSSSIRPKLSPSGEGFVLDGYEADYEPSSGPGRVHLKIGVDYREVSGLRLPQTLRLDSSYDETPTKAELVFSDFVVKRRQP